VVAQGSAYFCDMVLLELWNSVRGDAESKFLAQLELDIESVPTTSETWSAAKDLARACRIKGLTVPATDLLIAVCAQSHGLSLLHHDTHFDLIAGLSSQRGKSRD
jgi:predicted nucleic acid-binding protein